MANSVLLYVEDEEPAVYLMQTALQDGGIGAQFFRVHNGEEALAFLENKPPFEQVPRPDMILLDLNLPKLDGFQLLEAMRKQPEFADIPVVVFTSSSLASDRRKSLALGANDFITKPSNLDDFFATVQGACAALKP